MSASVPMPVVPIVPASMLIDDLRLDHSRWSRLDVCRLDVYRCDRLSAVMLTTSRLPIHRWGSISRLLHDDLWLLVDNGRLAVCVTIAVTVMVVSAMVVRHLVLFVYLEL